MTKHLFVFFSSSSYVLIFITTIITAVEFLFLILFIQCSVGLQCNEHDMWATMVAEAEPAQT